MTRGRKFAHAAWAPPLPLGGEGKGEGVDRARRLRRDLTDAETLLWSKLRDRKLQGLKFRRQYPIAGFIADFACVESGILVEIDGGQHTPKRDQRRSAILEVRGFQILRYWNNEVLRNIEGVLSDILSAIATPSPLPLPPGGEGDSSADHR